MENLGSKSVMSSEGWTRYNVDDWRKLYRVHYPRILADIGKGSKSYIIRIKTDHYLPGRDPIVVSSTADSAEAAKIECDELVVELEELVGKYDMLRSDLDDEPMHNDLPLIHTSTERLNLLEERMKRVEAIIKAWTGGK